MNDFQNILNCGATVAQIGILNMISLMKNLNPCSEEDTTHMYTKDCKSTIVHYVNQSLQNFLRLPLIAYSTITLPSVAQRWRKQFLVDI